MSNLVNYLLIIHIIIVIIYFILSRTTFKSISADMISIIALIPYIGFLVVYSGAIFTRKNIITESEMFSHRDVDLDFVKYEKSVSIGREIDIVPLEEALMVNDNQTKRNLLFDSSVKTTNEFITNMKVAVKDKDYETSQYAASIIMESSRTLLNNVQSSRINYEENRNVQNFNLYVDSVKKYLDSGVLEPESYQKYSIIYIDLLKELINQEQCNKECFEEIINVMINSKILSDIDDIIDEFIEKYPTSEQPYKLKMKYNFEIKNIPGIKEAIMDIRKNNINVSKELSDLIKFWES